MATIFRQVEVWGIITGYFLLTFATCALAVRAGRPAEAWLFYAVGVPGISLIHAFVLYRRARKTRSRANS